ncbi:hypothetical protein ACVK00_005591 [Burkholderia sp. PvR073]
MFDMKRSPEGDETAGAVACRDTRRLGGATDARRDAAFGAAESSKPK